MKKCSDTQILIAEKPRAWLTKNGGKQIHDARGPEELRGPQAAFLFFQWAPGGSEL